MKKVFSILLIVFLVIVVTLGGVLAYISVVLPDVGDAPELKVDITPERLERGKYLATAVNLCIDCHSTRDWTRFAGPPVPGTFGKGGERFDQSMGFPGVYYSKNITPAGIGQYSDGELFRVITTGVDRHGAALFPVMPYMYYGRMDEEDVFSLIAYIRSLEPIENDVPPSTTDFPMNFILNTIPAKQVVVKRPDPSDITAYGAYLINAAGCAECHTQAEQGQLIEELLYAGGREFKFPDGSVVRSSNLTPDDETGIGRWSRGAFIERFKMYADSAYVPPTVGPGDFQTIMPWLMYAQMTDEDLGAIYAYLQTLKPLKNTVVRFSSESVASRE